MIGHGCTPTGYSRVMHSLIPHWTTAFEVHHFALNVREVTQSYPWPVYPNRDPYDMHGFNSLEPLVRSMQPELILVSNNFWYFPLIAPKLKQWSPNSKVAVYFPIDGDRVRPSQVRSMALADLAVTFTQFGVDTLRAHPDAPNLDHLIHLPHGVDRHLFYPLVESHGQPDRQQSKVLARKKLLPTHLQGPSPFIVLNSNRNQHSKRIDLSLKGFELFAKNKLNVYLYLNMAKTDTGANMWQKAVEMGLEDRVIFSRETFDSPALTNEELNLLYNACDVGVNTSMGEGWGLGSFEHAAVGCPQIVPGHSACQDLWEGIGEVLSPPEGSSRHWSAATNTAIDPVDLAAALEKLYTDLNHYQRSATSCYAFATHSRFNWATIAERWEGVLMGLVQEPYSTDSNEKELLEFTN